MHRQAVKKLRPLPPEDLRGTPPLAELSDEALMAKTQLGDRDAFGILFTRYFTRLVGYLDRTGRGIDDVEAIAQETFLQAFRYARTYRYPRKFADWFFTIARNLACRHRRAWCRGAIKACSDIDPELMEHKADVTRGETAPFQRSAAREEGEIIRGALDRLPDHQRLVIALGVFDDLSYAQIEQITGVKAVTLRSHMFKGIRKLSDMLVDSRRGD